MQIGEEEPLFSLPLTRYFRSAKVMQIGEEEPLFSLPIAGNRGVWQRFNLLNFRSLVRCWRKKENFPILPISPKSPTPTKS